MSSLVSGLFGGGKSAASAAVPPVPAPVPMPDLQDPAIMAAQKNTLLQAVARSGRASTLLSGGTDDYSGSKLGSP